MLSRVRCGTAVVLKMKNALLESVYRVTETALALLLITEVRGQRKDGRFTALNDAPVDTVMTVRVSKLLQRNIRDHWPF